jgi:hypothetical protein
VVTALQTVIVAVVIAIVLVYLASRRHMIGKAELLLAVWAVVTWILPLTEATVSLWRNQAALAPLAVLVARLPRPVAFSAVAALVAISVPMAILFFDGTLI